MASGSLIGRSIGLLTEAANRIDEIHLVDSRRILVVWGDRHDKSWYTFEEIRTMAPPHRPDGTQ